MILKHIAKRTGTVVIPATFLYAYTFGIGDLYMLNVITVP